MVHPSRALGGGDLQLRPDVNDVTIVDAIGESDCLVTHAILDTDGVERFTLLHDVDGEDIGQSAPCPLLGRRSQ